MRIHNHSAMRYIIYWIIEKKENTNNSQKMFRPSTVHTVVDNCDTVFPPHTQAYVHHTFNACPLTLGMISKWTRIRIQVTLDSERRATVATDCECLMNAANRSGCICFSAADVVVVVGVAFAFSHISLLRAYDSDGAVKEAFPNKQFSQ